MRKCRGNYCDGVVSGIRNQESGVRSQDTSATDPIVVKNLLKGESQRQDSELQFRAEKTTGSISEDKYADFMVITDLQTDFKIQCTYIDGEQIFH
jgi:hypothetical protein